MLNAPGIPVELVGLQPRCFNETQWVIWVASESEPREYTDPNGFCSTCTPEFQADMLEQGRCRYPNTKFVTSGDNDIQGKRDAFDQSPAVTCLDEPNSKSFRAKMAPILALITVDGPINLRTSLFGPRD